MHEASIALSIIETAEDHCRRAGYGHIKTISLRIGKASGTHPEALIMAFGIMKLDTMARAAELVIEEIPLGGACRGCKQNFETSEQYILACPICESKDFILDRGREMDILEIEVE